MRQKFVFHPTLSQLKKLRNRVLLHVRLAMKGSNIVIDARTASALLSRFSRDPHFHSSLHGKKVVLSQKARRSILAEFNRFAKPMPFDAAELKKGKAFPTCNFIMADPHNLCSRGIDIKQRTEIFKKWLCLRHALVKNGAHVHLMRRGKGRRAREVYTRDRYLMIGGKAYLPDISMLEASRILDMYSHDYRDEVIQANDNLRSCGIETVVAQGAWFEGGNVIRHFASRTIFVGVYDAWTSEESARKLLETINRTQGEKWSLVTVPLKNYDTAYHLDLGMSEELPHGEVLLWPRVTDEETYKEIRNVVGHDNVIEVNDMDAKRMITNMISIDDALIMTADGSAEVKGKLESLGYRLVLPGGYGQSSFEFGQGGVHCMTNDLPKLPKKQQVPCAP